LNEIASTESGEAYVQANVARVLARNSPKEDYEPKEERVGSSESFRVHVAGKASVWELECAENKPCAVVALYACSSSPCGTKHKLVRLSKKFSHMSCGYFKLHQNGNLGLKKSHNYLDIKNGQSLGVGD
jgi:hypothetical protein